MIGQLIGAGVAFAWAFGTGLILFLAIKYTIGLRVSEKEEEEGLDVGEHGGAAYTAFPQHNMAP
jgi:Amt family ammonium transporter